MIYWYILWQSSWQNSDKRILMCSFARVCRTWNKMLVFFFRSCTTVAVDATKSSEPGFEATQTVEVRSPLDVRYIFKQFQIQINYNTNQYSVHILSKFHEILLSFEVKWQNFDDVSENEYCISNFIILLSSLICGNIWNYLLSVSRLKLYNMHCNCFLLVVKTSLPHERVPDPPKLIYSKENRMSIQRIGFCSNLSLQMRCMWSSSNRWEICSRAIIRHKLNAFICIFQ